jgi:hypothetical protein
MNKKLEFFIFFKKNQVSKVRNSPIQSKNRSLYLKKKKENKIRIILKKKQKLRKKKILLKLAYQSKVKNQNRYLKRRKKLK